MSGGRLKKHVTDVSSNGKPSYSVWWKRIPSQAMETCQEKVGDDSLVADPKRPSQEQHDSSAHKTNNKRTTDKENVSPVIFVFVDFEWFCFQLLCRYYSVWLNFYIGLIFASCLYLIFLQMVLLVS